MSDWIKTAKVGDRIVCVDANGLFVCQPLQSGEVYVIREIVEWYGEIGILLDGIHNEMHPSGEYGYYAHRFRPVTPRKTDITVFTDILRKVGKPVTEAA